ncbi:MAG: acyl carrier protein [Phycisphaerales bacterium]|nr:acyl carrier protein [Phycisphaerales bacterium]
MTENRLRQFLAELRHVDGLTADKTLFSDGTIDSVGLIALIGFLEQTCGFEIDQAEVTLENFDSIQRVLDYVANKLNKLKA